MTTDKKTTWDGIITALREIEDAAEHIDMNDIEELHTDQLATIGLALRTLRGLAHDYIRPDLEVTK